MALKFKLESLDGLDESIKALYKEENGAFFLDVEGVVPKERHDEFRTNNINLNNEITALKEKYKGVDPEKYATLLQLEADHKSGKLKGDDVDVEALVAERVQGITQEFETEINGLKEQLTASNTQLEVLLIDSAVAQAGVEHGVAKTAATDVALRARSTFKVEKGVAVPYKDGSPVYGRDGVTPKSVTDWVKDLKRDAPHLFEGNAGGGAGGGQGDLDPGSMSSTDKISAGREQRAG